MEKKRNIFNFNFIVAFFVWGLLNNFNLIYADTYYIAPYGDDNNPGTLTEP